MLINLSIRYYLLLFVIIILSILGYDQKGSGEKGERLNLNHPKVDFFIAN